MIRSRAAEPTYQARLEGAALSGYLLDDRYGSWLAEEYQRWCWENAMPIVIVFPWRRLWAALELMMPPGFRLSGSVTTSLTASAQRVQDPRWQALLPATFTSHGGSVWGLDPDSKEGFAQTVATTLLTPGEMSPSASE